ncbi:MAG: 2-C-methyl-D-erythritol 2,4-cyclodiphosphate synthase [Aureliella sp.]
MAIRVGLGHDTHRLEPGGPLRLGGIDIEFDWHLAGHSDADVLLHAITDAILGAANLGDIGQLFPDNADENRGRDSGEMLAIAAERVTEAGWRVENLDCVVLAERPKLLPWKGAICSRIGEILSIAPDQVSLKGKTGERTGDIGEGRVMQSMVVCLLERK